MKAYVDVRARTTYHRELRIIGWHIVIVCADERPSGMDPHCQEVEIGPGTKINIVTNGDWKEPQLKLKCKKA